jgi:hypothetical protein
MRLTNWRGNGCFLEKTLTLVPDVREHRRYHLNSDHIVCVIFCYRWRVELFFIGIRQHLRIKTFFGTFENAIKTQAWITVCVYMLVAIVKIRLDIPASLHTMLQILSLTLFERTL